MKDTWDTIIIGGGPSGMMSASIAAARGLKVLLLEKNPHTGKKLRITGGGRCNISNATFDNRSLLSRVGVADQFLFSVFAQHSVKDSLEYFKNIGIETKEEPGARLFPISEKAEDVALALEEDLKKNHVEVRTNITVTGFNYEAGKITSVKTRDKVFYAKTFILATGGTSRPETGSTGDGYKWLLDIGHKVITPTPSLVPIVSKDSWLSKVAGIALSESVISIYLDKVLIKKSKGKVLFTHQGLSGPGILNLSSVIGENLRHGEVQLRLNLNPLYTDESLTEKIKQLCLTEPNKKIKNLIKELVPSGLISPVLSQAGINEDRNGNTITRQDRHHLTNTIRGLSINIHSLLGADKAIIASGGVDLSEINFKNMSSKLYPNLHIVGDLLNIQRPSGGYSLQLCWTTGFVAGNNC
jgi:predicted Rossmann fold flavoprotein